MHLGLRSRGALRPRLAWGAPLALAVRRGRGGAEGAPPNTGSLWIGVIQLLLQLASELRFVAGPHRASARETLGGSGTFPSSVVALAAAEAVGYSGRAASIVAQTVAHLASAAAGAKGLVSRGAGPAVVRLADTPAVGRSPFAIASIADAFSALANCQAGIDALEQAKAVAALCNLTAALLVLAPSYIEHGSDHERGALVTAAVAVADAATALGSGGVSGLQSLREMNSRGLDSVLFQLGLLDLGDDDACARLREVAEWIKTYNEDSEKI